MKEHDDKNSATPRTDGLFTPAETSWETGKPTKVLLERMTDHARQLERESEHRWQELRRREKALEECISARSSTPSLGNGANGLRWFLETFLKALDVHNGHGTPSLARAEAYALEAEAKLMLAGHSTTGTIQWSGMNDLTDWSPKEDFDALVFANYTEAKKAEVLFNRLLREAESAKNWLRAQRDTAEEKLKETAPSAIAPKWIPRSERMPEPLDNVLVHVSGSECDYTAMWDGKAFCCWRSGHFINGVTHWMPLPSSPNNSSDGGNKTT